MHLNSEVASTIKQFFRAMDTQDLELMKDLLPKESEMIHIGTDKDEIWKGWDILIKATRKQFENLDYYKANIHDLTINISESGETAWYFHLLDAEIKSGGNINTWENARFTGVLEKRGGRWKLMQTHVSLPESATS